MFIITLTYKKSLEIVDQHVFAHRAFLDEGYAKNYFIASGPQNPRTGGIIISCLKDRKLLEDFLRNDPYQLQGIADYHITEFMPVKSHKHFEYFINL